ncbi:MAG: hypothetical protein ABSA02_14730 [Trebonia sp.]
MSHCQSFSDPSCPGSNQELSRAVLTDAFGACTVSGPSASAAGGRVGAPLPARTTSRTARRSGQPAPKSTFTRPAPAPGSPSSEAPQPSTSGRRPGRPLAARDARGRRDPRGG